MIKTYKSTDKLLCISDCSRNISCQLISYNQLEATCNYFNTTLTNQTNLIESNGQFLYPRPISNLKGIQYRTIKAGCQVTSLILLPDSNLANGCSNGIIKIWNTYIWSSIISFSHGSFVFSFAILQNRFLISTGTLSGMLKAWDYRTGTLKWTFSGHANNLAIRAVFVLNNDNVVSGSNDKTAKIWNSNDSTCISTLNLMSEVLGLTQLINGNLVAICINGNITIWKTLTANLQNSKKTSDALTYLVKLKN